MTLAGSVRVDDEQLVASEVGELLQVVADLVGGLRVLAHHEQDRALAGRRQILVELAPATHRCVDPAPVALHRRIAQLRLGAVQLADHRRLDDPVLHRLGERVVDDDVPESPAFLILGRCGEVELGDHTRPCVVRCLLLAASRGASRSTGSTSASPTRRGGPRR